MNNNRSLLFLLMHTVFFIMSMALTQTINIPGQAGLMKSIGMIMLVLYALCTLAIVSRSSGGQLVFIELWKLCILIVFAMYVQTAGNGAVILSFILLTPFAPLMTVNLTEAFILTAVCLGIESLAEFILIRLKNRKAS